jgi:hypothetical protein
LLTSLGFGLSVGLTSLAASDELGVPGSSLRRDTGMASSEFWEEVGSVDEVLIGSVENTLASCKSSIKIIFNLSN